MSEAYPRFWAKIVGMVGNELLERETAVGIARKADVRVSSGSSLGPDPAGAFTDINDPLGYRTTLSGVDTFPITEPGSLTGEADLSDKSEARLLANVIEAFGAGSTLSVAGAFSASVPIDVTGLFVSEWQPVGAGEIEWSADGSGSGVLGLAQAQTR